MDNTTNSSETPSYQPTRKDHRNAVIGLLSLALIGVAGYLIVDKNRSGEVIQEQQNQITATNNDKSEIQKSFDASLVRLDSMTTAKNGLETKLGESNKAIAKDKAEIRSILNKKNATAAELNHAKDLIAQLNGKINDMEQQIAQLTQQNQSLTQDKEKLTSDLAVTTADKQNLQQKIDIASTLNASNITIVPVRVKSNGKVKVTEKAKRADKMQVSFDVNNRIAASGSTDIYVYIIGPDGKQVTAKSAEAGTFTTREGNDMQFTAKVPVMLDSAKTKTVKFDFVPGNHFTEGNYTIQLYQNGFKIGEATRELKKSGLFS